MKKNLLLLLTSLMMACIGAGCSGDDFDLGGDKIVFSDGYEIKYSPMDVKDYPEFLHIEELEASDDFSTWFGCYIWTGILDGEKYYAYNNMISSQMYGYIYTETGEFFQTDDFMNWTDIEVIYIHPKYIDYCKQNKSQIRITVPRP